MIYFSKELIEAARRNTVLHPMGWDRSICKTDECPYCYKEIQEPKTRFPEGAEL